MAENSTKIKLLKLYEILQKDTDEDRPLSRTELFRRLNEQGVNCHVRTVYCQDRTIDRDVETL